jgi:hypothetical protein
LVPSPHFHVHSGLALFYSETETFNDIYLDELDYFHTMNGSNYSGMDGMSNEPTGWLIWVGGLLGEESARRLKNHLQVSY